MLLQGNRITDQCCVWEWISCYLFSRLYSSKFTFSIQYLISGITSLRVCIYGYWIIETCAFARETAEFQKQVLRTFEHKTTHDNWPRNIYTYKICIETYPVLNAPQHLYVIQFADIFETNTIYALIMLLSIII